MKKKFKDYLLKANKKGSQKANSYIRALELLDDILNSKVQGKLLGFKSIYEITSISSINELYLYILEEQKNKNGIFKNEEPSSYWNNGFYSAALKSYYNFLNIINTNKDPQNLTSSISILKHFKHHCDLAGLKYKSQLITRYISSLATKPFVLLSGLSGSGKTKLAQSFAQWICQDKEQYCIVPVGADWTNREPLLGYVNALETDTYVLPENGALQLIIDANKQENQDKPYFLILDEMNLSHVERYFADFLSVMESKDKFKLHSDKENEKSKVPYELDWPKNLFVVGTVNIDETTYMFSPKVLDRANVIEFRVNETEIEDFLHRAKEVEPIANNGKTMASSFIAIAKEKETKSDFTNLNNLLLEFFKELQVLGAEFGYRTASEIQTLFSKIDLVNPDYSNKESEKIDIAIMQKLLPKLHGSRRKLLKTLNLLANKCLEKEQENLFNERGECKVADDNSVKYKLSFGKITRMYKSAIENGFASYAEA